MCVGNVAKATARPAVSLSTCTPFTVRTPMDGNHSVFIYSHSVNIWSLINNQFIKDPDNVRVPVQLKAQEVGQYCTAATQNIYRMAPDRKSEDLLHIKFDVACVCLASGLSDFFFVCQTCQSHTTVRSVASASPRWKSIGSTSRSCTRRTSTSVQPATRCLPVPPCWTNTRAHTLERSPSAVTFATNHTRWKLWLREEKTLPGMFKSKLRWHWVTFYKLVKKKVTHSNI